MGYHVSRTQLFNSYYVLLLKLSRRDGDRVSFWKIHIFCDVFPIVVRYTDYSCTHAAIKPKSHTAEVNCRLNTHSEERTHPRSIFRLHDCIRSNTKDERRTKRDSIDRWFDIHSEWIKWIGELVSNFFKSCNWIQRKRCAIRGRQPASVCVCSSIVSLQINVSSWMAFSMGQVFRTMARIIQERGKKCTLHLWPVEMSWAQI